MGTDRLRRVVDHGMARRGLGRFDRFSGLGLALGVTGAHRFVAGMRNARIPTHLIVPGTSGLLQRFVLSDDYERHVLGTCLGVRRGCRSRRRRIPRSRSIVASRMRRMSITIVGSGVQDVLGAALATMLPRVHPVSRVVGDMFCIVSAPSVSSLSGMNVFVRQTFAGLCNGETAVMSGFITFGLLIAGFRTCLGGLCCLVGNRRIPTRGPNRSMA